MKLSDLLLFFFTFFVYYMLTRGVDATSLQLKEDGSKSVHLILDANSITISVKNEASDVVSVEEQSAPFSIKSENFALVGVTIVVGYYFLHKWLAQENTSSKSNENADHVTFKWNGATYILIKCEDELNGSTARILHRGRNTSFDSEITDTGESYV